MRALVVVVVDPLVKILLQRFQILVNLFAERYPIELVEYRLVEALADAVRLR